MDFETEINKIKEVIEKNKNILITCEGNASLEVVVSCLNLALVLRKIGKNPKVVFSQKIPSHLDFLKGKEMIKKKLPPPSLVVSVEGVEDKIEKINYYTKGDKFNFIIIPKFEKIGPENVSFYLSKPNFDSIFVLGTESRESLNNILKDHKESYENIPLVNIDTNKENSGFGTINFINSLASCLHEILFEMVGTFDFEWDSDLATSFLTGIYLGTNFFQGENTSAKSFEIASRLLSQEADLSLVLRSLEKKDEEDEKGTKNQEDKDINNQELEEQPKPSVKKNDSNKKSFQSPSESLAKDTFVRPEAPQKVAEID